MKFIKVKSGQTQTLGWLALLSAIPTLFLSVWFAGLSKSSEGVLLGGLYLTLSLAALCIPILFVVESFMARYRSVAKANEVRLKLIRETYGVELTKEDLTFSVGAETYLDYPDKRPLAEYKEFGDLLKTSLSQSSDTIEVRLVWAQGLMRLYSYNSDRSALHELDRVSLNENSGALDRL